MAIVMCGTKLVLFPDLIFIFILYFLKKKCFMRTDNHACWGVFMSHLE